MHFVIEIDPNAQYEWNKVAIRSPFTGEEPNLKELVNQALAGQAGHYLTKVSVSVEVVEHQPLRVPEEPAPEVLEDSKHLAEAMF